VGRRFVDVRWIEKRMKRKDERVNTALAQLRKGAADMDRLALAPMPASTAPAVTADELELIRKTIAKDATPEELKLFLYDCARQGVHPLDKLIHFTKRGREGRYTPITSIDFMRIRAADSGECIGSDDATFAGTPMTASFEAHVTVYRLVQGQRAPFTATARWTEYKPDQDFMWKRMPHLMLAKCAEALALRKAFPKQLHGLYVKEEMEQAADRRPLTKSLKPSPGPAVTDAVIADPGLGVSATPANLNQVPEAWRPFVQSDDPDRLQGRVVNITDETKTNRKGTPFTKWSITLDSGELVTTLDRDHADTAIMAKHDHAIVGLTTKDTRWGKDILTIARIPEAGDDAAF
jgi:phage recombination protein Bet